MIREVSMMKARWFASFLVVSILSTVHAQEGKGKDPKKGKEKAPATLAEAHAELEKIFSHVELAKIDAMKSEKEMIRFHRGTGAFLRNSWGLWRGSPLRDHMRKLGFTHPDDMSAVILETFWCKRHGKEFRLEERAKYYAAYWKAARKAKADKTDKVPATLAEAHAELQKTFPLEELARIDAMKSEKEMIRYHRGVGASLRNSWGLWRGSPLGDHMRKLGFTHPDDMATVILETFWCMRHGKDLRLEERAKYYAAYWEAARKAKAEKEK